MRSAGSISASVILAIAAYIAAVALLQLVLPVINEVPEGFPPSVLWDFRIASLGTRLVMWTTMGLLFGALVQRGMTRPRSAADDTVADGR